MSATERLEESILGGACAPGAPRSRALVRIEPPGRYLGLDVRDLWRYRELLYFFVWRDVKIRYKQTVIGAGWAVIQPLLTMGVFTLFFGYLAKLPSGNQPYPIFYMAALVPWMYFASSLSGSTGTIVENRHIVTKVFFPRVILPLAAVLSPLVDLGIGLVVLLVMTMVLRVDPSWTVALLPLFVLLAAVTALGVGLWLGALNVLYRDVRYTVPFLVQLWLFLSPVAYGSDLVPKSWLWVYGLNPMAGVVEGFRWAVTGTGQLSGPTLVASVAVALLLLAGGFLFFQRIEADVADVV